MTTTRTTAELVRSIEAMAKAIDGRSHDVRVEGGAWGLQAEASVISGAHMYIGSGRAERGAIDDLHTKIAAALTAHIATKAAELAALQAVLERETR